MRTNIAEDHNILGVKFIYNKADNKKYLDKHISIVNRFIDNKLDEKDSFQVFYASIYAICIKDTETIKNIYKRALIKVQNRELDYNTVNMLFRYPIHNKLVNKIEKDFQF